MPIKDLSDVVRLPRLGKIHLGTRDPKKGYPIKTDYFVLPGKEHSSHDALVKLFGEKPKSLRILIPVEDEETWCSQYYRSYNLTKGLVCKGDGEKAMRMVDNQTENIANGKTETVSLQEVTCAGKSCPVYQAKKCKETMNLRFLIPEAPGLGIWQIDSGSINSILNINSSAALIRSAFKRISLIPLLLTFEPQEVNNPETGKRQTVYVLNLRTNVTIAQLAEAAREQKGRLLIEAPDDLDPQGLWDNEMDVKVEPPPAAPKPPAESNDTSQTAGAPPAATNKAGEVGVAQHPQNDNAAGTYTPPEIVRGEHAEVKKSVSYKTDPATIKNKGQLQTACHNDFAINSPADIIAAIKKACPEMTINSMLDITDWGEAYRIIAGARS